MTNKEAIKMLEEIRDATEAWYGLSEDGRDMFWLAISALQQPKIVRCKDCKHWDGVDTCDVIDAPVWDNDFCSLAERRSHE